MTIDRSTNIRRALRRRQRGFVINPFAFGSGGGSGAIIATPADDNITAGNEGTSTTGWSTTSGSLSQSGSTVRLTGANGLSALALASPTSNDYVLLIKMAANHVSNQYGYLNFRDGVTSVFDIIMGFNYETNAAQLGTISTFNYSTGAPGNNIATGVTYSTQQEFAIHVDRNRSCVNLFYREPGTGKWDFRGSYAYNAGYGSLDEVRLVTSNHAGQWVEYDWILYCRPNGVAIGDSIPAGHNHYDPNPSVYAGEDDYGNTWMKHAALWPSLRNNLIVNKGIGSESSTTTQARIAEATAHSARVIFLHASTNDEALGISKATRTTNIQNGINSITGAGASAVLLNAMYGTSTSGDNTPTPDLRDYMLDWWTNPSYRPSLSGLAGSIDIMQPLLSSGFQSAALTESDGLHPTAAGYQAIGEYIDNFQ
jgi:lysophospholipase L1-like esterase